MSSQPTPQIRTRRVFYIPGYDPFPPRRYRELYRKESAAQAEVSGYYIALKPQTEGAARYGWHIDATIEGQTVETDFTVLTWSDIVQDSMERGIGGTYFVLLRTAWIYIASGALFRLMRLRKGPVIAALYPVGFLLVQLILSVIAGAATIWLGKAYLVPWLGQFGDAASGIAGVVVFVGILKWFKAQDGKFFAYYLMLDYAYSAQSSGANPPELEARMAEFVEEVVKALKSDVDEVLVVGHSSGAHLGVSILADVVRTKGVPETGPALSFLTLGQVVPMVSFLPEAHRLRADLAFLSKRKELSWVDVTAPGDGCAFALCDPVSVSGVAPDGKRWPLVISAAFTQTLSPERWRALRWRFFRLHFQYLCAFDRPGDYDYFQITAGPHSLGARFADRQPSPSRIETPASRYTSVAV
ncbi:hypothetical protein [Roseovarius rhodophyticola]|uniref:Alpha/beta hydrolase n=1 Tax=Roseovarius rhodophyticola TaxID=3080827 RepID=A0ABZ2TEC6_9RHOB|nr:hypothetical protein [Roseovarius sp. W115]MDV2928323.1 hypothetical protein [Roseovarius sp. W115]